MTGADGIAAAGAPVDVTGPGMTPPAIPDPDGPVVPRYGPGTLGAVMPGAARALGVDLGLAAVPMPAADAVCVVLIDGLGSELLAEAVADGQAPFLASVARAGSGFEGCPVTLRAGCPTTTATSMGSLGTGLPPGTHGLVGYKVRDPERGVMLNELRWDPYTDPLVWQPLPTVFGRLADAGVGVTRIGAEKFRGSGMTVAAQRGGEFIGCEKLGDRVDAALAALSAGSAPALVYLYWGEVDGAGHAHGWRSDEWRAELRAVDRELERLAARLPAGTNLVVTADHGMVDTSPDDRLDVAKRPELRAGIAAWAGEPRMVQLYCRAGRTDAVASRMAEAVGDRAWVRTRARAVAEGWFGEVVARVEERIGDVLIAARGTFSLVDSDITPPEALKLVGHHGSLTEAEQLVPLITHRA